MFIGIGIGINRGRFAGDFAGAYNTRVLADGGVVEALSCVSLASPLLQKAKLLLIPSGTKVSKVYSALPKDGNGDLTWSRNSSAVRVNSAGIIESPITNVLLYSEALSNPNWIKIGFTATADSQIAPDGTLTADTLSIGVDGAAMRHRVYPGSAINVIAGLPYTWSCYVKKANHRWIQLLFGTTVFDAFSWANFDLENGVVGSKGSSTTAYITDEENGWYRISITAIAIGTGSNTNEIISTNNTNSGRYPSYQSLVAEDIAHFWGFQVDQSFGPRDYVSTTAAARTKFQGVIQDGTSGSNIGRLDYSYGSCPAVLLEPQRTNLALRSTDFADAVWLKANNATVVSNSVLGPNQLNDADTIQDNLYTDPAVIRQVVSVVAGSTYTFSVYLRTDAPSVTARLRIEDSISPYTNNFIDVNPTSTWTRYQVTRTIPVGVTAVNIDIFPDFNKTGKYVYAWGAQFEQGAYATTYIPTTSATATRIADTFTRNNIYTNGLIGASGGTWFLELKNNVAYTRDGQMRIGIGDTTSFTTNSIWLSPPTSNGRLVITKTVSGINTSLFTTATDNVKIAIKWNGTSADVFVNGTKQVSATAFTTTLMENLLNTATTIPVFIQAMALFNTALSDSDCVTLTT